MNLSAYFSGFSLNSFGSVEIFIAFLNNLKHGYGFVACMEIYRYEKEKFKLVRDNSA